MTEQWDVEDLKEFYRTGVPPAGKAQLSIPPVEATHRFTGLSKGDTRQRGVMNKTETLYAGELEALRLAGEVADYWFNPMRLRLTTKMDGKGVYFTVDFMVLMSDGLTFIDEVKGSGVDNDAAIVRVKSAAEKFPLWKFRLVKRQKADDGGDWKITEL